MLIRFGLIVLGAVMALTAPASAGTGQPSDWQINLQGAVTAVAEEMHDFHWLLLVLITAVTLLVLGLLVIVSVRYNAKANPVPSRTTHNTVIEVIWTVLPVMILVVIAIPSFQLLYQQYDAPEADLTIKATGHQWYWSYEYQAGAQTAQQNEAGNVVQEEAANVAGQQAAQDGDTVEIAFDSTMVPDNALQPGQPRLLAVDNEVVVPVNKVVRLLVTAGDVIHSFAVPSFGIKADGVPGRLNETWFRAEREGVYYGQCSELCGKDHAFMPIAVRVVSDEAYAAWMAEAKQRFAATTTAPVRRVAAIETAR
ncbi:cytochrome c oxidase subunit 2 [Agaricicola taiwanensis]|uniref:Cytochrome c oxidase subunit 2 n=1 Tax=Agaricicola taiwanensis TaxID=591372 RepID=A0A8J2YBV4_9RHOB|nr:cytochrome c oxidase subunit II [Agaricicola taiwanensis]GGE34616.1 cytochrome c oxidase subunit 2 [Agaricicola taiwanensis]